MTGSDLLISVHYHPAYVRRNVEALRKVRAALQPSLHVAISNGSELQLKHLLPSSFSAQLCVHSNEGAEFGAYHAGLQHALSTVHKRPRWVIFVNDTLGNHATLTPIALRRFRDEIIDKPDSACPIAIGKQDFTVRSFAINGLRGHRWIRTHIFALNAAAIEALGHRMRFKELDSLIPGGSVEDKFFDPAVDPTLRERLRQWLFADRGPMRWYGACPLDEASAQRMTRKARSILHEMYLSLILEHQSCIFIDVSNLRGIDRAVSAAQERIFETGRSFMTMFRWS